MATSAAHRRRALQIVAVGLALTLLTVILDRTHQLGQMENRLYDYRLTHCQNFGPPPTTQIVHLDIDEQSIGVIPWPVPRGLMANMVREISHAGAKGIFLDVIYAETTNRSGSALEDKSVEASQDDLEFAKAIKEAGNVIVPASFQFKVLDEKMPLMWRKMVRELEIDPERDSKSIALQFAKDPEIVAEMKANPREAQEMQVVVDQRFLRAREQAVYTRIDQLVGRNVAEADREVLRQKLFPHLDVRFSNSVLTAVLDEQYKRVHKDREFEKFSLPIPVNLNEPLLNTYSATIPLPALLDAAAESGYVEPLETGDGRLRSIVLGVNYRGRMVPHASLTMACETLGVPVSSVKWSEDKVTIPFKDGRQIDLPVSTRWTSSFGRVPYVFDIPWWGNEQWEAMYDYPDFSRFKQRYPLVNVYDVSNDRQVALRNNRRIYQILGEVMSIPELGMQSNWDDLQKNITNESLQKTAGDVIDTSKAVLQSFEGLTDLKPNEKTLRDSLKKAMEYLPGLKDQAAEAWVKYGQGQENLKRMLNGKVVFVGWTATGALDFYPTTLHAKCPGVVVHGTVFNGITTGRMWKHMPDALTAVFTVLLGVLVTFFIVLLTPVWASIATILLAAAYYVFNGYVEFDYGRKSLGLAGPTLVIVLVSITLTIIRYCAEMAERNRLTKRFRSYVDPKLVNYVIENPDQAGMRGTVKEMSVVFTDLEGFTTLSEALKEKTVPMLSEYMGEMVPLIRSHNGYVNKFLGDGIMFFFNAPYPNTDHAADAVMAVLDMQRAMVPFNEKLKSRGLPTLNMRVGIVSGDMVVGDAGPENASDYTVLGDNVNLASRLEGANKMTGTNTMIHWKTKELLGERFLCRPVGKLMVKGKTEGVMVFEPLGAAIEADDRQREIVGCSEKIVQTYIAAEFDACIAACDEMDRGIGASKFTKLYRLEAEFRKEEFKNDGEHVKNFAGVITLSEK